MLQEARIILVSRNYEHFLQINGILLQPSIGKYDLDIVIENVVEPLRRFMEEIIRDDVKYIYIVLIVAEKINKKVDFKSGKKDDVDTIKERELISLKYETENFHTSGNGPRDNWLKMIFEIRKGLQE